MNQKYTQSLTQAFQRAQTDALQRENQALMPEHVLSAFVTEEGDEESGIASLLSLAGVSIPALKAALQNRIKTFPQVRSQNGQLYSSPELQKWVALAEGEAKKLQDEYLAPEHLILASFLGSVSHF